MHLGAAFLTAVTAASAGSVLLHSWGIAAAAGLFQQLLEVAVPVAITPACQMQMVVAQFVLDDPQLLLWRDHFEELSIEVQVMISEMITPTS